MKTILLAAAVVLSACDGRIGDDAADPRGTEDASLVRNQPPHAYAAFVTPVTAPAVAQLNGAQSSDPDGRIVAYRWTQGSGPNTATLNDATAINPIASNLTGGTYRFFLEVTDDRGAKNTDFMDLLVFPGNAPAPNAAPVVNAGADQANAGAVVTLSGAATDPDGAIASVAWTKKSGGSAGIATPTAATTTVSGLVPGVYVFTFTATDDDGASASDDVQITVAAPPSPTTTRVCAAANEWLAYPTMGTLSLACPAGQTIQSVSFASYGTPNGSCGAYTVSACHAASSVAVLQGLCVGKASCSATNFNALFGDPCPGTSKRISAQVECAAGSAPVVDAGTPPVIVDAGTFVDAGSNPNPVTALSFSAIPTTDPDLVAPGRGLEIWHGTSEAIAYPTDGSGVQSMDHYFRFSWSQLETARDVYDWTRFDGEANAAIDSGRKFAFGVMTLCPGCDNYNGVITYAGSDSAYPQYLHQDMQAETTKDWISPTAGSWIPNWNSTAYLTRFEKLLQVINAHMETTAHNGVLYKNAVNYIDIRGYGAWGEWHNGGIVDNLADASQQPQAARATTATLNRIIDAHVNGFPNHQLVAMIAAFDANRLQNTLNPPAVGLHALQTQNARGYIGWRRDNWGCLDDRCGDYLRYYSDLHPDLTMRQLIMDRYTLAPVNGEPMNGGSVVGDASGSTCFYFDLKTQVERYHASSFGNGNFQGVTSAQCARDNIRAAAKVSGYRLLLTGGSLTANVGATKQLSVRIDWRNAGLTPSYEDWAVTFELRNAAGTAVWTATSSKVLRLFLPSASSTSTTDAFVLPASIAAGSYTLKLVVKDPKGFRKPLPLAILGRATDGSYPVGTVTVP